MEKAQISIPTRLQRNLQRRKLSSGKARSARPVAYDLNVQPIEEGVMAGLNPGLKSESEREMHWRPVARSQLHTGFDDAAVLAFEELEGVDVVYEDLEGGGRVAKFAPKSSVRKGNDSNERASKRRKLSANEPVADPAADDFDDLNLLPEWASIPIMKYLKRQMHVASFSTPTAIQAKALPVALSGKDVVGVAETGSGKTLAYGLPILQYILSASPDQSDRDDAPRKIKALVLAPTRELALQVSEHLRAIVPQLPVGVDGKRPLPPVSIAAIVGGMSAQKQKRLLDRGVDVLIATPGRLWDLIQESDDLASQIRELSFLVLDEADRMIEAGHFQELDSIVKLTVRPGQKEGEPETNQDPEFAELERRAGLAPVEGPVNEAMQTFVYSATLSKDLQRNLKRRKRTGFQRKKNMPSSTLDDLLLRLDFRDPEPEVIDLSPEGGIVSTLQESKIECVTNDKDLYLYYFLLRYPGRSLVFVSSIDSIRRIMPLLEILQVVAFPLHSQLQQKQRLKNLDRFKAASNGVLIATDVAARGLDIPSVDHVVHYQLPRTADTYVHRNGRTARAKRDGFSLQLCGPDERKVARALLNSLGRAEEVPELNVEYDLLNKLRERITLARQIDNAQHNVKKANHEKNWLRETADALEIELSDDEILARKRKNRTDDDNDGGDAQIKNKAKNKVTAMRVQMKSLLAQPLVARGISLRYLTSGSRPLVEDLLTSSNHRNMLGLGTHSAQEDVEKRRKKIGSGKGKGKHATPNSVSITS